MFHYTIEVNFTIHETITKLEEELKKEEFGVLWTFNVKDKLTEKGITFDQDFVILEVCNPKEAKNVLEQNPYVSYFLPCKIVVFKDKEHTKIGLPRPTFLINMLEDASEELINTAKLIEKRLILCIENVTDQS